MLKSPIWKERKNQRQNKDKNDNKEIRKNTEETQAEKIVKSI